MTVVNDRRSSNGKISGTKAIKTLRKIQKTVDEMTPDDRAQKYAEDIVHFSRKHNKAAFSIIGPPEDPWIVVVGAFPTHAVKIALMWQKLHRKWDRPSLWQRLKKLFGVKNDIDSGLAPKAGE